MLRILKIAFRSLKNIYYDAFKCIFIVVITSFNMKFDHNSLIIVTTIRTSKSLLLFDDFDEHGLKLKFRNFLISLLFRSILGCSWTGQLIQIDCYTAEKMAVNHLDWIYLLYIQVANA